MKKKVLFVAALFGATSTFAQIESKNGWQVLPEAGDYAISMDAIPVIDFALNAVNIQNNVGSTAQHPGYVGGFNQVIVGKYFADATTAYRAKVAINTNSTKTTTYFDDLNDVATGVASPAEVSDEMKSKTTQIILGGGMEMRRGHNRLQGFYGGEVLLGFNSSSTSNTYGMSYDATGETNGWLVGGDNRVTESKSGMGITFGLRGFAGVEYFFAPKISVGAEFGWGLGITTTPRGETTTEYWDDPNATGTNSQRTETKEGPNKSSSSGFQADNDISSALGSSAALTINFHF